MSRKKRQWSGKSGNNFFRPQSHSLPSITKRDATWRNASVNPATRSCQLCAKIHARRLRRNMQSRLKSAPNTASKTMFSHSFVPMRRAKHHCRKHHAHTAAPRAHAVNCLADTREYQLLDKPTSTQTTPSRNLLTIRRRQLVHGPRCLLLRGSGRNRLSCVAWLRIARVLVHDGHRCSTQRMTERCQAPSTNRSRTEMRCPHPVQSSESRSRRLPKERSERKFL